MSRRRGVLEQNSEQQPERKLKKPIISSKSENPGCCLFSVIFAYTFVIQTKDSHNMLFLMLFKLVLSCASVNGMFNLFKGTEMRLAAQLRRDSLVQCIHPVPSICTGNKE